LTAAPNGAAARIFNPLQGGFVFRPAFALFLFRAHFILIATRKRILPH
jgi:hypothetical protein